MSKQDKLSEYLGSFSTSVRKAGKVLYDKDEYTTQKDMSVLVRSSNKTTEYRVTPVFEDDELVGMSCTCPNGQHHELARCKHAYLTLLVFNM